MTILGKANLTAATNTTIATAPSGGATVNVYVTNRTANPINVRLAMMVSGESATPTADDYFAFDFPLPPNGMLRECGLPLDVGDFIVAWANAAGVSVQVAGLS